MSRPGPWTVEPRLGRSVHTTSPVSFYSSPSLLGAHIFVIDSRPESKWQHEDGSVMMFDYLVQDNHITLDVKDEKFIKALISGDPSQCAYAYGPFVTVP